MSDQASRASDIARLNGATALFSGEISTLDLPYGSENQLWPAGAADAVPRLETPQEHTMNMFKSALKVFTVAVLLAALTACTSDGSNGMNDDDDETPIALADMPAPVRSAILALTPEQNITQLSTEIENGATVYEVEYTANGQAREAEFNARGETLADDDDDDGDEEEDDDDDDDGEDDD